MKIKLRHKFSTRMIAIYLINSLIIISVLSFWVYKRSYNMITSSLGSRASEIVTVTSASVNTEDFKGYRSKEDMNKDTYKALLEKLQYIRKVSGSKYLYAVQRNENNDYIYILDASENPEEFGAVQEAYDGFDEAYNGKIYISDEIDIDEYGYTVSAYAPIKDGDNVLGFIGADYDAEDSYKEIVKLRGEILILAAVLSVIAILFAAYLAKYVSKPIEDIARVAEKFSKYDLTVEKLKVRDKGEIGVLADTFNNMVSSIGSLIERIRSSSITITKASESLAEISEDTRSSITEVSTTVEEIAGASNEQVRIIELGTSKANYLAESIQAVSKSIDDISKEIRDTENLNQEGTESMKMLIEKSKYSVEANEEACSMVMDMEKSSEQISSIVEAISEIAKQTNLLALNASIESARAGEYGKGFAVVADEIRKLAVKSAEETSSIRVLIESMQEKSRKAALSMNKVSIISTEHQHVEASTQEVFNKLSHEINVLASQLDSIRKLNEDMMKGKEEFINIITNILSLSQENSASTEETSVLSGNVKASVAKLNEFTSELQRTSKKLHDEVERFRI
jgi:methyl-accepting chemotaxis protein